MVLGSDKIKSEHIKPMNDFTGQECVGHFHEHKLYKKAYILKTTAALLSSNLYLLFRANNAEHHVPHTCMHL